MDSNSVLAIDILSPVRYEFLLFQRKQTPNKHELVFKINPVTVKPLAP